MTLNLLQIFLWLNSVTVAQMILTEVLGKMMAIMTFSQIMIVILLILILAELRRK